MVAEGIEQVAAFAFGKLEDPSRRIDETAGYLVRVAQQALAQRQRIDRERHTVDQGMPAMGGTALDSAPIALHYAHVPQWSKLLELALAHTPTGRSERVQQRL